MVFPGRQRWAPIKARMAILLLVLLLPLGGTGHFSGTRDGSSSPGTPVESFEGSSLTAPEPFLAFGAHGPVLSEDRDYRCESSKRWVVKVRDEKSLLSWLSSSHGNAAMLGGSLAVVELPSDRPEDLRHLPGVEWAEEDVLFRAASRPNDPDFPLQWNLPRTRVPEAWDRSLGDPSVVVAVVDSGIAYRDGGGFFRAPDLAEALFVPGYDFVQGDPYPDDDNGHGTMMASIIASGFNNRLRGAGIAPRVGLMPIKVLDSMGKGYASWVASGIRHAADSGAQVICLGVASSRHSLAVADAVRYAFQRGCLLVAAAGNEGSDPGYPGGIACPADEEGLVLAVGATDMRDLRAHYSNQGKGLDVVAPGGDLTRDDDLDGRPDGVPQESYRIPGNPQSGFTLFWGEGTSLAAAQVAAVCALLASLHPKIPPSQAMEIIRSTARDLGPRGWDPETGYGMVDASAALARAGSHSWYLAEGTTRGDFHTWLCLANPSITPVTVEGSFLLEGKPPVPFSQRLEPLSRSTIFVNQLLGEGEDFGVLLSSDHPFFAERAMYYLYKGAWAGGDSTSATPTTSRSWFFAEGTTRQGFEMWLCLMNPNDSEATVKVHYLLGAGQGQNLEREVKVPARSRRTVFVNDVVGGGLDVAMRVESDLPVVAERPMYFDYKGFAPGGHDVMGTTAPSRSWFFAEGTTRQGFEMWLCLMNPNDSEATVKVHYLLGAGQGQNLEREVKVPARSRRTVFVNDVVGGGLDVAMRVESDLPVVAERPMYFLYGNGLWGGGSCELGFDP